MVGIESYGAYIPYYRLSRVDIAKMWGEKSGSGEKAVANFDEDSVTMSVAACMDCLTGVDPKNIDGVYFASTTPPYMEKQSASIVATATDFRRDIFSADFSGSLRGGTSAIRAAMDAINGGSAKSVLVCGSDVRMGFPQGGKESSVGDGAGALLLGNSKVIATIEGVYSVCNEILDVWRSDRDHFVRCWEDRFVRDEGYCKIVPETVSFALKKHNMVASDFTKAIFASPSLRFVNNVAKKLRC